MFGENNCANNNDLLFTEEDRQINQAKLAAIDEIRLWIEKVTLKNFKYPDNLQLSLADGIILCSLLNTIRPGSIKKINRLSTRLAGYDNVDRNDNIGQFLKCCEEDFGLSKLILFEPSDLDSTLLGTEDQILTDKRIIRILLCLFHLIQSVQDECFMEHQPKLNKHPFTILMASQDKSQMKKRQFNNDDNNNGNNNTSVVMEKLLAEKQQPDYLATRAQDTLNRTEASKKSAEDDEWQQRLENWREKRRQAASVSQDSLMTSQEENEMDQLKEKARQMKQFRDQMKSSTSMDSSHTRINNDLKLHSFPTTATAPIVVAESIQPSIDEETLAMIEKLKKRKEREAEKWKPNKTNNHRKKSFGKSPFDSDSDQSYTSSEQLEEEKIPIKSELKTDNQKTQPPKDNSCWKIEPNCQVEPDNRIEPVCQIKPDNRIEPVCQIKPDNRIERDCQIKPDNRIEPVCQIKPDNRIEPVCQIEPDNQIEPDCQIEPNCQIVDENVRKVDIKLIQRSIHDRDSLWGLELNVDPNQNGIAFVSKVQLGSCADICDLRRGDQLISVNQERLIGLRLDQIIEKLKNHSKNLQRGDTMVLNVQRKIGDDDDDDDEFLESDYSENLEDEMNNEEKYNNGDINFIVNQLEKFDDLKPAQLKVEKAALSIGDSIGSDYESQIEPIRSTMTHTTPQEPIKKIDPIIAIENKIVKNPSSSVLQKVALFETQNSQPLQQSAIRKSETNLCYTTPINNQSQQYKIATSQSSNEIKDLYSTNQSQFNSIRQSYNIKPISKQNDNYNNNDIITTLNLSNVHSKQPITTNRNVNIPTTVVSKQPIRNDTFAVLEAMECDLDDNSQFNVDHSSHKDIKDDSNTSDDISGLNETLVEHQQKLEEPRKRKPYMGINEAVQANMEQENIPIKSSNPKNYSPYEQPIKIVNISTSFQGSSLANGSTNQEPLSFSFNKSRNLPAKSAPVSLSSHLFPLKQKNLLIKEKNNSEHLPIRRSTESNLEEDATLKTDPLKTDDFDENPTISLRDDFSTNTLQRSSGITNKKIQPIRSSQSHSEPIEFNEPNNKSKLHNNTNTPIQKSINATRSNTPKQVPVSKVISPDNITMTTAVIPAPSQFAEPSSSASSSTLSTSSSSPSSSYNKKSSLTHSGYNIQNKSFSQPSLKKNSESVDETKIPTDHTYGNIKVTSRIPTNSNHEKPRVSFHDDDDDDDDDEIDLITKTYSNNKSSSKQRIEIIPIINKQKIPKNTTTNSHSITQTKTFSVDRTPIPITIETTKTILSKNNKKEETSLTYNKNKMKPMEPEMDTQQQQNKQKENSTGQQNILEKKCHICGESVGSEDLMIIEELQLHFHLRCFCCSECGHPLSDGKSDTDVRVRRSKLHCADCYTKKSKTKTSSSTPIMSRNNNAKLHHQHHHKTSNQPTTVSVTTNNNQHGNKIVSNHHSNQNITLSTTSSSNNAQNNISKGNNNNSNNNNNNKIIFVKKIKNKNIPDTSSDENNNNFKHKKKWVFKNILN